jgi:cytochrome P450
VTEESRDESCEESCDETSLPPEDVYAEYTMLRASQPVSRDETGPWRVARYEDVRHVLRSHADFSSLVSSRLDNDPDVPPSMLFSDPPVHDRLRALVNRAFTPRQINAQSAQIEARCEALVKDLASSESADLVTAFAAPLPVGVIATMLGVEDGDFAEFKDWSDTIFQNIGEILLGTPSEEAVAAGEEMNAYFLERIADLRRKPQTHLLSELVHVETEDGRLTDPELLMFCRLLLIAGNETTTSLIVGCTRMFHEMPESFDQLKRSPELIPGFIEETLRYHSPFKATLRRATRDIELCGQLITEGELVLPLMASANRDERIFDRASEFVLDRSPNPHLAFGLGIHSCLGSTLARLEARIAVTSLLRHLDGISLFEPDMAALDGFGAPASVRVELRVGG